MRPAALKNIQAADMNPTPRHYRRHGPFTLSALSALSALTLALCAGTAFAQTPPVPDAGRVLRDLQQAPGPLPAPAAPLPGTPSQAAPAPANEAKVQVNAITITGNQALPTPELQALVADLVGSQHSLSELKAGAARITAYYRERGFAVARAYLPAQDITSGAVTISVIEGRIASQRLANQSRLSDANAQAYLGQIKDGDVIRSSQIDRGLLLLRDTPGVGNSRATLQPGASVGTSELLVELDAANASNGSLALDNYGSRYTGEYRLGGNFNLVSPLGIGDQLSFSALSSGSNLNFGRLAYQAPVGSDGLRLGAAYFDTRYKLGKEFAALQAHGQASSTSVFAAYPFVRSQLTNLSGTLSYEAKRLNDYIDSTATATGKQVNVISAGLNGNLQDTLGGGGVNSFDLALILGRLRIDSPTALAIDAASAQSSGNFTRVAFGAARLQRLSDTTALSFAVSGQRASKNLDSSEKFSLGGPNAVRAYPQGEGIGDEGQRATLELRQAFGQGLQGIAFYDVGSVKFNKNAFGPAAASSRTLAGAGIGLNASVGALQLRSALAWRTKGGAATSVPEGSAKSPTLWLQALLAY
jgi:hemolysin activation/secretion protein